MIVVGLTGSIGMGKSTTAGLFTQAGVPVYDADATVHALYASGGAAVEAVRALFPGAIRDGAVDRTALAAEVVGAPDKLRALEQAVHPLVAAHRAAFFDRLGEADVVVLDIPLLFETGGEAQVDKVVVVSAPQAMQRERVLARPGMTPQKLDAILARQLPDADKRARADFVIDTSQGIDAARRQVADILARLRASA